MNQKKRKRNSKLKRLAAVLLAGVLFAGSAMTALAADTSAAGTAEETAEDVYAADSADASAADASEESLLAVLSGGITAMDATDGGDCGDYLTWSYEDGVLTITGYGQMTDYTAAKYTPWYSYQTSITSLIFVCTDTSVGIDIGNYAFYGCTAITTADLSGVVTVGNYSFRGCTSLASITGDPVLTEIGSYGFWKCSALTGLDLSHASTISTYAFYSCSSLKEVTLSEDLTQITAYSFQSCTSLEKVVMPGAVTILGASSFASCSALNTIVLSEEDTATGTVTLPESLLTISNKVFSGCTSITSIDIQSTSSSFRFSSISSKTYSPFYNCTGLQSITLPSVLTEIPMALFYCCSSLTSVTIPEGVTSIGNYAFASSGLTSISIPDNVTSIGLYAFSTCSSLEKVSFTESSTLTTVNNYAFANCTSLTEFELPDSVTTVGTYVFSGCSSLASLTFGSGVTSIGLRAVYNVADLIYLYFKGDDPDSLSISSTAFEGITGIAYYPAESTVWPTSSVIESTYGATSLTWAATGETVTSTDWYSIDEDTNTLYIFKDGNMADFALGTAPWYSERASIESIKFNVNPDDTDADYTLTSIGNYAFYGLSAIESVEIPAEVTSIGTYAFAYCALTQSTVTGSGNSTVTEAETIGGLQTVTFENGSQLTEIDTRAFAECGYLSEIEFPETLTEIGSYAFYNCGSSVSVANLVYILGSGDTSGASVTARVDGTNNALREVKINEQTLTENTDYTTTTSTTEIGIDTDITITLTESYLESLEAGTYSGTATMDNYELSFTLYIYEEDSTSDIVSASGSAQTVYSGLSSISLEHVQSIGEGAFYGCCALESVKITDTLATIGLKAFYNCEKLSGVTLPDSVTSIGSYAFSGTALTSVSLPANSSIGAHAFDSCSALSSITFGEGEDGDSLTLGDYVFSDCTALPDVTLPSSFTEVNTGLFEGCSSLTEVTLEGAVTKINEDAFSGCTALTTITGLSSLTTIGDSAFYNCSSLKDLELPDSVTNSNVGDFAFYGCKGLADSAGFVIFNGVLYTYVYSVLGIEIADTMTGVGTGNESAEIQDVVIDAQKVPGTVTEIANYAFYQIFATAGGTNSTISTVQLEGIIFTCDAADVTFEEYAFAGLPLDSGSALICYPCSDQENWESKLEEFGLSGSGSSLGYRYDVAWNLTESVTHQYVATETSAATCTEDGYTVYVCSDCGDTYTDTTPAIGHSYDTSTPAWTWAEDYSTASVTFTCANDASHTDTVTAEVTSETTEASCTEDGEAVYTAAATYNGTEYTDTQTVTLPATGHSYDTDDPEWTWTEDLSSATVTFTCENDAAHTETVEATVTSEVTTEAGCTTEGVRTYTAAATFDETEYTDTKTETIDAAGHTYLAVATEPTCTEAGYTTFTCSVCGDTFTMTGDEALGHDYEETWTWAEDYSSASVTLTCIREDDEQTYEASVSSETVEATADADGYVTYTAVYTDADGNEYTSTVTVIIEYDPTGDSSGSTDDTSGSTDDTSGSTDDTSGSTDDTSGSTDDASGSTDDTSGSTDDTSGSTDDTSGSADDTSGSTDGSSESTGDSSGSADDTSGSTDGSSESTGGSSGSTGGSSESTGGSSGSTGSGSVNDTAKSAYTVPSSAVSASKVSLTGATEAEVTATLQMLTDDGDLADSTYSLLQAKAAKVRKTSIKVSWKKVSGAVTYVVYANQCGKGRKLTKLKTTSSTSLNVKKIAGKKVKSGKYYKFLVVALDENGQVIATSKTIHTATKGGKVTNEKSLTLYKSGKKVSAVTLKKGKSVKLTAKTTKQEKAKTLKQHRKVKYESSNTAVATVTGSGKIKAKAKGTCYIYAYAQNGVSKKIKVTVK